MLARDGPVPETLPCRAVRPDLCHPCRTTWSVWPDPFDPIRLTW